MAKNYSDLYNSTNDSISLDQRWYLKEEATRGVFVAPTGADYFFTKAGGGIEFTQPFESSPHRSGRHHNNIIKKKKELSWGFSTYFNIDTGVAAGVTEIEPAMRVLWKSLLGKEDTTAGVKYTAGTTPSTTFSLYEVGDKWARQSRGCFVQGGNCSFPGDGEAGIEWSGAGKDAFYLGIGKSTTNNTGNTVTLVSGDGGQFKNAVGGLVMVIKSNGTTRSTDTPDGSPRTITAVVGDVVTLSGAALTDSDGSGVGTPIYLSYYEPATPVGIDNPQTGLQGSFTITGLGTLCARSVSLNMQNDHEIVNYCYGSDSASGPIFVPGSRMTATLSFEMNMNKEIMSFFHNVQNFDAQVIQVILGDPTTRHLDLDVPKAFFSVPSFSVPETGSVPVTFEGTAYQTALDAADEVSVHFK